MNYVRKKPATSVKSDILEILADWRVMVEPQHMTRTGKAIDFTTHEYTVKISVYPRIFYGKFSIF